MTQPAKRYPEPSTASSGATPQLLTMQQVQASTTYSRPSIYRLIAKECFPRPIKLGGNKIAFFADEVAAWIASRERAVPAVQADRDHPNVPQDGRS